LNAEIDVEIPVPYSHSPKDWLKDEVGRSELSFLSVRFLGNDFRIGFDNRF